MNSILITNNPMVAEKYKEKMEIIFLKDNSYLDVLSDVRNRIHEGHEILTHPLSGSVKPNETPYKSVLISKNKGKLDMKSLQIIEGSIDVTKKFLNIKKSPEWTKGILEDFQLIDYSLIKGAVESMIQF
ncbi:GrdX family protein [Clostridium sediminicola]|uniref:GrdX family protein n=1 Tax=Clostridium sediminicola TaxID=3114879 RepID=UPI0031F20ED4